MNRLYLTIFIVLVSTVHTFAAISKDSNKWTKTTISKNQTIEFDINSPDTIELSGTITIGSGYTLTILNNSGKTITITKTVKSDMFTNNGSLIITGSDNNHIVLDGGADYSFSKSDYSLISNNSITGKCITSKGYLDLQYVTIQNCNNYTGDGGAINLSTSKQTQLDHCLIQNCTAWRGSAIIINANTADPDLSAVKISNSTITQCVTGGASNSKQNNCGGAIRTFAGVSSNLYLTNVTMSWNYSRREIDEFTGTPHELYHDGNGGALFWNGRKKDETTCYIDGCTFEHNKCDDNGGAIKAQGSIKFCNNITKIRNNIAPLGAGIYIEGYTGSVSTGISSITYDLNEFLEITDNEAVSYIDHNGATAPGKGAGIYFDFGQLMTLKEESTITVDLNGATINNNISNEANGLGGGIYYEENSKPEKKYQFNIYLNHGEVNNNSASANGGGIYVSKGDVTYSKVEIGKSLAVKNNSASNGAGIYIKDGNLYMANGTISGNTISGTGNGGGIYIENGDFTIDAGEVSGNTLTSGQGAGVYIVGSNGKGNFTMNGGEIKGNTASGNNGGGVYINGGNFTLNAGTITENKAVDGGGVYLNNGNFSLVTGEISGNTAAGLGGGVYLIGKDCEYRLKNGAIETNTASSGGGVYLANGSFILAEDTSDTGSISSNSASGNGGGVYIAGEGGFTMNGGTVELNRSTGDNGGGIFLNGGAFLMGNGTIEGNSSSTDGGGVCIVNNGSFTMNNGDIKGNGKNTVGTVVTQNGGGVYIDGGTLTVTSGNISSNASNVNGGGVYIMNGTVMMGAGKILANSCGQYGGGVYVYNSSTTDKKTVTFNGGTLSGNSATYGGGVCVDGLIDMSIGNVEIAENTATNGGGVCLMNKAFMEFGVGEIKNNTALKKTSIIYGTGYKKGISEIEGFGGGVFLDSNTTLEFGEAENLGLFGNLADYGGDEIFANGDGTYVDLPDVSKMALGGYPGASNLKWIEDYPNDDSNYGYGTKLKGNAWDSDKTNLRYRETIRQNAQIYNLTGAVTGDSRYICFALGYEVIYITIIRQGLGAGESAIYHLSKNEANDFNIILTGNSDGDPVTKKVAVTAGDWTVTETPWSWAYGTSGRSITRAVPDPEPETDPVTGKKVDRPFVFNIDRTESLPMNSEDIEVNIMGN